MEIGYQVKSKNPKENVTFISKLFFGWMAKIVRKGTTTGLQLTDLFKPLDKDKSKNLTDRLEREWQNEISSASENKTKPNLLKTLRKIFFFEFMIYGILWFIFAVILKCASPLFLARLISLYSEPYNEDNKVDLYVTSAILVGITAVSIFFQHHVQFGHAAIGMRIRTAASSLVYRKINKLSHKALGQTAAGQIVNILSNDVSRFDLALSCPINSLWVMPIQAIVLSYFIWQQVGVASLAGVISMAFVCLPVQMYLAKLMGILRDTISKKTDKRVKIMNEIISGIQVIKMYAWEKSFEKLIKIVRASEIKSIRATSHLRGVFATCLVILEKIALFVTIICFILQGNYITADMVFSMAQAFNILQLGMAHYFAWSMSLGAETLISIRRIEEFLLLEEREESQIEEMPQNGVILFNVNASWENSTRTLGDILLEIPPGSLCAVIGPVGSGKSSLLQLLLGELPLTSGRIQIGKEISYSSQEPWLFQSTVRNNILFGKQYKKALYEKVVKVCALERDFEELPLGDKTIVGERGVSLSGGQRARINLARAVYRQADIYLLDDPLSAVDAHVGKQLFDECINKHLKGKTRVLVTHQLQYLKDADLIVVINEGHIEAKGTFKELYNSSVDFTKLLSPSEESQEYYDEVESSTSHNLKSKFTLSAISGDVTKSVSNLQQNTEEIIEEESGSDPNSKPFTDYLLATKNMCLLVVLILMLIVAQAICAGTDFWVAIWTEQEAVRHINNTIIVESTLPQDIKIKSLLNDTTGPFVLKKDMHNTFPDNTTLFGFSFDDIFDYVQVDSEILILVKTKYAIYFYGILVLGATILTLIRSVLFFEMCMMSSANLHSKIFHSLLQAPMKFFNDNSSGRILNRVSKDIGAIDEILPNELLDALQIFLVMCGILVNIAISNQYSLIIMVVLGILFLKMRTWYMHTAQNLKHLETKTKSPIFSQINSTLNGISTIRASRAENLLIEEFDNHQDVNTSAWYLLTSCIYSFGLWLDIICVVFMACICFSFVVLHSYSSVSGSMVGLALAQSMVLTTMLQQGLRQAAEVINNLISVERVMEYTNIDTEGPFETLEDSLPKDIWGDSGLIDFENVYLRYADGDPAVLKDLNISILPGEKVGIVGRTGAGKSSLIAALFHLTPFDGTIYIDGEDTKEMGLSNLRKKISIIPQEPVLFSATLRYNLDPFNEFEDYELWSALQQVDLKETVDCLDYVVAEGGSNFSLGEKQLICLARALLRNNKILVLDEATANVDPRTDLFIQAKIREKFNTCTVLTIAHRLNTIMDSDRVLVMSFGRVVEFDHPFKLLQIPDGHFQKLVMETGESMALQLKEIARNAYTARIETTETAA